MKKWLVGLSLILNLIIALPVLVLLSFSPGTRFYVYQSVLAPHLGKCKIAFLGDSITHNAGLWGPRIGEYNFAVWNFGQGNYTTSQITDVADSAAQMRPRYAFIMAGINDEDQTLKGAEKSFHHYEEMLQALQKAGTQPVIESTLYRETPKGTEFVTALNGHLREYAAVHKLPFIDLNSVLAPHKFLLHQYTTDGLHLNEAGYEMWGRELRKFLSNRTS